MPARTLAGPVLVSVAVHAAAAVTIGGVLGSGYRFVDREPETLDVDVALVINAHADESSRQAAPGTPAPPRVRTAPRKAPAVTTPPARFVLSAGTVATGAAPPPSGPAAGSGAASAAPTAFTDGDVDVRARLLAASPLVYPPAARDAEIEIDLPLEIVVDATGRVVSARAVIRAGYGLDESALRAIRDYRFSPALRAGRAVPVRMRWTVQFRLR